MAINTEKLHPRNKENGNINRPLSSSTTSSGRKLSANQRKSTSRSSADQRKSASRSSGGRAKSTHLFRDSIRSAVPDSAIITIAKRPDQGGTGN
jgi:hypothetical protein